MTTHFQQLYEKDDDPWQVRQRWYEQRKRNLLLASLPEQRFRHVFEPGCGNGELTAALVRRADHLTASDGSTAAVRLTRRRIDGIVNANGDAASAAVLCQRVPESWPENVAFDLIVISEMAYYLTNIELHALRDRCINTLTLNGALVLCHWRHPFADRLLETDAIHHAFDASPQLHRISHHEEPDFLLDVWSRSPRSVAQREGVTP